MDVHGCYDVRPYSNWWTSTAARCTSILKLVDVHGCKVVRPYSNWWTSTYVMWYVHIVTGGRPWPHVYVHIETGGRPRMLCCTSIEKLMDVHLGNFVRA